MAALALSEAPPQAISRWASASGSAIPNRVSIDERPEIVDQKNPIGDWEGDTMIGKHHCGVLVPLGEEVALVFGSPSRQQGALRRDGCGHASVAPPQAQMLHRDIRQWPGIFGA